MFGETEIMKRESEGRNHNLIIQFRLNENNKTTFRDDGVGETALINEETEATYMDIIDYKRRGERRTNNNIQKKATNIDLKHHK